MKCWKCGAECPPDARFCGACGADQLQAPQPPQPETPILTIEPPQAPQPPQPETPILTTEPPRATQPPQPEQPVYTNEPPQTPPPSGAQANGGWANGGPAGPAGPGGGSAGSGVWDPNGGNENILKIFALVCAAVYGIMAVIGLVGLVRLLVGGLFGGLFGMSVWWVFDLVFALLTVVLNVGMCLILVVTALKRTPETSDGLLVLLGIVGILQIVVRLLDLIFTTIQAPYLFGETVGGALPTVLGALVVVGGVYAIRRFLLNEAPLLGKTPDELQQEVQMTLNTLGQTAGEIAGGAKASMDAKQQARQAQQAQQVQQAQQAQQARQAQQAQWQAQQQAQWQAQNPGQPGPYGQQTPPPYGQPPYGQNYGRPTPPPSGYAPFRLKTDRSLLTYILLTIVTCGIYGWYFLYCLARDINVACDGDGKNTAGLVKLILLTIVTCGIYSWIWHYSLGNRLAENAPRYGLNFQENGTTVLMWMLFGSLLCGIGPFIAMNILIKNANMICGAYNNLHGI